MVPLFTLSTGLLLLFAFGVWMSANGRRTLQWMGVMMALNCIDALLLPVVVILGSVAFPGPLRRYTVLAVTLIRHPVEPALRHVGSRVTLPSGPPAR